MLVMTRSLVLRVIVTAIKKELVYNKMESYEKSSVVEDTNEKVFKLSRKVLELEYDNSVLEHKCNTLESENDTHEYLKDKAEI